MQLELQRILAGTASQFNMADDILIGGTVKEHDEALKEVCKKLKEAGITLNKVLSYRTGSPGYPVGIQETAEFIVRRTQVQS